MPLFYDTWPLSAMANGQIKDVGNAGNDRVNCYQTVIKGWKLVLRWAGYLIRDSLLWAGKLNCDKISF